MIGKRTFYPNDYAQEYIADIMATGRISYGKYSKQLENMFANIHRCRYGVLSNSGTSSLQVALQALKEMHGWKDGSEVIVPALTFVATANVVLHNRMIPVLVDVDPTSYNISVKQTMQEIEYRGADVKAIMPVHLFGQPADMLNLHNRLSAMSFAPRHRPKVIEDSCEAVLANHQGHPVGSWSDVGCFSFYMAHHIQAGVGGIGITDNPDLARKMRSLVNHGMVCDTLDGLEFDPSRDFVFESVGHSFRMTEFEAALALSQLPELPNMVKTRQENAEKISLSLVANDLEDRLQLPAIAPGNTHSFMMYPIVCRQEGHRDAIRKHLHEVGIGSRLMLPLTNQPVYRGLFNEADYPVTANINRNGFYVSCGPNLTNEDIAAISLHIADYYRTH